ncbi:hypothetical protein BGZ61DRAFT_531647 [Ilyonectria robusta]|uniref:uncharacterized protein n=1 Tax=Ilyonectria robusta TaxID=1079257 RepID=UPI001E8E9A45|nr:uncharacterized protein BGZ61DRAFT_531647 [Ilyonectria robusta]KAH8706459.1 hypothetical protein BGZ61DRAFT_531647 [Ilyonectria robusta]
MAVFKINALASVVALLGVFASTTIAEAAYSDCSSTLPPVTQESGLTTSEGTVLFTWSVCNIVHQTACSVSTSVSGGAPPAPTDVAATVPGEGQISSYAEAEHGTSVHGENEPSQSVPYESVPAGGSQPGYSVPPPRATGPGESGQPSVPGETPTAATYASGNPSSAYPEPSDGYSDNASHSRTGTNPTATDGETPSGASGTPTSTATGAATMANPLSAAILGVAGMVVAIFF